MALPVKEESTRHTTERIYESECLNELYTALAKAQFEMEAAKTDKKNPYYKSNYADLFSIIKASRPCLAQNGLSVMQRVITTNNGRMHLFTRLCHASGQWSESSMPINPPKDDIQTVGKYITYLRRYMYAAIVGVTSTEDDDDGESSVKEMRSNPNKEEVTDGKITQSQLTVLSHLLCENEDILNRFLKAKKISRLSDLPSTLYADSVKQIQEIIKNKNK